MIQVKGLVKTFGNRVVLQELDLQIGQGEFVALLGPNGAGKTTLIRILASLLRSNAGKIMIASRRLPIQAGAARRQVGLVSHQPYLYRELTAKENLWFFGRLYQVDDYQERTLDVLEMVGLMERKDDLVRTYSRGMQQRLAIARAVLHQPQILLFDEPYTGLDQDVGERVDEILTELSAEGRTILMTSHDLTRSAALASRIDVLSKGRITASQPTKDLQGDRLLDFYRQALEPGLKGR